jgi:adenine C2-methylase RlmN of 23S rRNA A2503 and tRNA A37
MGLSGSLSSAEILEQIIHADKILADEWNERKENLLNFNSVRNVVFMGMGEPLDNYNSVVDACRALIDKKRWNLAHGRVTVSTVGLVSKIRKLSKELPEVNLALSLHAPNQAMRSAIVPTAKQYPIEDLIDALDGHMMANLQKRYPQGTVFTQEQRIQESSRRRAMIEYVMLEGDTSSFECAHELGKLCENRHLVVNLIPYNQTDVKDKLRCPSEEHMEKFKRIVVSYGTFVTIRRTMGADIDSACGQLITLDKEKSDKTVVRDIEDAAPDMTAVAPAKKRERRTKDTHAPEVDLDQWVRPLAVATAVAASCFVASIFLFFKQRRR